MMKMRIVCIMLAAALVIQSGIGTITVKAEEVTSDTETSNEYTEPIEEETQEEVVEEVQEEVPEEETEEVPIASRALELPIMSVQSGTISNMEGLAWVKSRVGTKVDPDGSYGAQCVDLIMAYYQYLGENWVLGNGCDYATNKLPSGWVRIKDGKPQPGDIIIYGAYAGNQYGHVAIYESDTITYHQNFTGHQYIEKITGNYKSMGMPYWGLIRPKWANASTTPSYLSIDVEMTDGWNAQLYGQVHNPGKATVSEVGVKVWDESNNLVIDHSKKHGGSSELVDHRINLVAEAKADGLRSSHTYTYQMWANVGGTSTSSNMGQFRTNGWSNSNGKWYYYANNAMVKNNWMWCDTYKAWFYFKSDGTMSANCWVKDGTNKWFHVNASGIMEQNQWLFDNAWYYLGFGGTMYENQWLQDGKTWYYLGTGGTMRGNGWSFINGAWYYMDGSGRMYSNKWIFDGGVWYYVGSAGNMYQNTWYFDGKHWYYLGAGGKMYANAYTPDGCWVNGSGQWVK